MSYCYLEERWGAGKFLLKQGTLGQVSDWNTGERKARSKQWSLSLGTIRMLPYGLWVLPEERVEYGLYFGSDNFLVCYWEKVVIGRWNIQSWQKDNPVGGNRVLPNTVLATVWFTKPLIWPMPHDLTKLTGSTQTPSNGHQPPAFASQWPAPGHSWGRFRRHREISRKLWPWQERPVTWQQHLGFWGTRRQRNLQTWLPGSAHPASGEVPSGKKRGDWGNLEPRFSNLPASKTFLGHWLKWKSLSLISRHLEFPENQSGSFYK